MAERACGYGRKRHSRLLLFPGSADFSASLTRWYRLSVNGPNASSIRRDLVSARYPNLRGAAGALRRVGDFGEIHCVSASSIRGVCRKHPAWDAVSGGQAQDELGL
jgi:hypothetical protein